MGENSKLRAGGIQAGKNRGYRSWGGSKGDTVQHAKTARSKGKLRSGGVGFESGKNRHKRAQRVGEKNHVQPGGHGKGNHCSSAKIKKRKRNRLPKNEGGNDGTKGFKATDLPRCVTRGSRKTNSTDNVKKKRSGKGRRAGKRKLVSL